MISIKNPCKGCPDMGCGTYHDKCPKYQEFRQASLKDYDKRKLISDFKYDIYSRADCNLRAAAHYRKKP